MKIYEGSTLKEVLTNLGIAKTSYQRMRKQGLFHDEIVEKDGERLWRVVVLESGEVPLGKDEKICSIFTHRRYMREWIAYMEDGIHRKPWSKTTKKVQISYIDHYFERYDLISADNLVDWYKTYFKDDVTAGTKKNAAVPANRVSLKRHMQSCVSSYARFLYERKDILSLEEYTKIKLLYPKKPPAYSPTQHIIYDEDLKPILEAIPEIYEERKHSNENLLRTVLTLLSETGLRVSELSGLKADSLNFSDTPARAVIKLQGKGGKWRSVPFSKHAQAVLREYMESEPKSSSNKGLFWVTNTRYGSKTTMKVYWLEHEIKQLSDISGIKFTAHSFRHYRATKWANDPRIPITTTQRWLGHESLQITQRYIHTSDEMAMQAAFA